MGIVMIRCPATGRDISTGIKVDRPRFECSPVFFAQTFCPFCRTEHQWFAKDAWVEDKEGKIGYEESGRLLRFYEDGLNGYTYLEQ